MKKWATIILMIVVGCIIVIALAQVAARTLSMLTHGWQSIAPVDQLKAINDARTSVFQILAGAALIAGAVFTVRTYLLTRITQQSDRLAKAMEVLSNKDSRSVRVGGVHVLWLLACENPDYWPVVEELLSAFVKEHAEKDAGVLADVQAAISVLAKRPLRPPGQRGIRLDFSGADLSNYDLAGINLERAVLDHTNFTDADLTDITLTRARLKHATLAKANFSNAKLKNADFTDAVIHETNFFLAKMDQADFSDADMRDTVLTREQRDAIVGQPSHEPAIVP